MPGRLDLAVASVPISTLDQYDIAKWALAAADAADDKVGSRTVVIEVAEVIALTDYFVITSGANTRQVRAIAEAIEDKLARLGGPKPLRIEGRDEFRWLLMDYGPFVVHVFEQRARDYYDLDRLWGDQPLVERSVRPERAS
jgi:ribosome-associated protein